MSPSATDTSTTSNKIALVNVARTTVQTVPSVVITEFIDAFVSDLSDQQSAALVGLLTLVIAVGHNLYETLKGRALFK